MKIYVDIDETICITPESRDYKLAKPIKERIDLINKMYDNGIHITYWTARGTGSGIDWTDVTINQLNRWGAKYNSVKLGKPMYDLFICDKAINSERFFIKEKND